MADHLAREAVRRRRRFTRSLAGHACRDIGGVEAVTRGGRIDRHHHFRHRNELVAAAGGDQRAVRPVLDDDLGDSEGLEPLDGRLRTGVAPQHGFVVVGRQRHVDALQRLHEHRPCAREIAAPAARAEISVERDLHALLADHLDDGEEAAEPVVGIERERDAGEIDQLGLGQAIAHARPVGQLEQLARRRFAAPIMVMAHAGRIGVDHGEARQPAACPQHEIAGDAFGGGEREDRVRIGIIPERSGERGVDPGTG